MIVQWYILKFGFIKWVDIGRSSYHCERFGKLTFQDGGKGCFRDSLSALFFFPWNVKWLIFSSWIMISIVPMRCDFAKLFLVKWEINVSFLVNHYFHYVFVIFDNLYYIINDIAWPQQDGWSLLRWGGWSGFSVTFHFYPLFHLFWPKWQKRFNAMSEMTKVTVCNFYFMENVLLFFR